MGGFVSKEETVLNTTRTNLSKSMPRMNNQINLPPKVEKMENNVAKKNNTNRRNNVNRINNLPALQSQEEEELLPMNSVAPESPTQNGGRRKSRRAGRKSRKSRRAGRKSRRSCRK